MNPILDDGTYFICFMTSIDYSLLEKSLGMFRENEGITFILREEYVPNEILKSKPQALITLNVNSDLESVGFLSCIITNLAKKGISINIFSAFVHDHILISKNKAKMAMQVLHELQISSQKKN
jgi:hypothetical protein